MVRKLKKKRNKEGIELIRQLVFEHIAETGLDGNNLLYQKFVRCLTGNTTIISMNFDCLLRRASRRASIGDNVYFDHFVEFDDFDNKGKLDNKQKISLIKLNGSLDWAVCSKCEKKTLLFPHITKERFDKVYRCKINECQGRLRPLIFLPHEEKDEIINVLWEKAREELKQATKITVIGYSFPPYDKDIINLFETSISCNVTLDIFDFEENVSKRKSKEEEIRKCVKNIFPDKKNVKISLDGFQGYMDQLRCTPCMK